MTQLELFPEVERETERRDARPVASILPDEGIQLYRELERYREWLVAQALIRTRGNRARAARLLGINRTTLVMMLRARAPG